MAERRSGVLFVCTGNICRSPTAEGVFRAPGRASAACSTGFASTPPAPHDYHVGEAPDARAIEHAARRGYDLAPLRARQVAPSDFTEFDRILAMDRSHLRRIEGDRAGRGARRRISMFLDHSDTLARPRRARSLLRGKPRGFEEVLDMVEEASARLLEEILAGLPR